MSDNYNKQIQEMIDNYSKEELAKRVVDCKIKEGMRTESLCRQLTLILADISLCEFLLKSDPSTNVLPILENVSSALRDEVDLQQEFYDGSV